MRLRVIAVGSRMPQWVRVAYDDYITRLGSGLTVSLTEIEPGLRGAGHWHGGDGPLRVTAIDTRRLLHEPLMASAAAAGFATTDDIHGEVEEGFARGEITVDARGRRASASRAYLRPVLRRPNVNLVTGALVRRVIIDRGAARGIEYSQGGRSIEAHASREVILCGGTFNSPQLLMLSGIGPADDLRALGLAVHADLKAVGRNLSEHARVPIEFATRGDITFLNHLRADRIARSVLQWVFTGSGACATQINSCNIVVRTEPGLTQPDVQLMCNPVRMDAKIWWPLIGPRQEHRVTADADPAESDSDEGESGLHSCSLSDRHVLFGTVPLSATTAHIPRQARRRVLL